MRRIADRSASQQLWNEAARGRETSLSPSPADRFTAKAFGKAWFVSAEMERPRGGRRVGGKVARRPERLEITVRAGGSAAARVMLAELGISGATINEMRRIPGGHGYSDGKRR
ncbi:MAG: hypothetical protein ACAI38_06095 [Myxococcota bacterium]|nr:hypothetical protein [Myxococcota bacterium]